MICCRPFQQPRVDIQPSSTPPRSGACPAARRLQPPSGNAADDAPWSQVSSASLESTCSLAGLLRARPGRPAIAAIASTHFSNILEWWLSTGLPGAGCRGAINAGRAPIDLLLFRQAGPHGRYQCSQTSAALLPLRIQGIGGKSCHGAPVRSRNKRPLRAASSLTASLRAPTWAEGTKAGMRGCSCRHSRC